MPILLNNCAFQNVGLVPRMSPRQIHRGADEGISPYNFLSDSKALKTTIVT